MILAQLLPCPPQLTGHTLQKAMIEFRDGKVIGIVLATIPGRMFGVADGSLIELETDPLPDHQS